MLHSSPRLPRLPPAPVLDFRGFKLAGLERERAGARARERTIYETGRQAGRDAARKCSPPRGRRHGSGERRWPGWLAAGERAGARSTNAQSGGFGLSAAPRKRTRGSSLAGLSSRPRARASAVPPPPPSRLPFTSHVEWPSPSPAGFRGTSPRKNCARLGGEEKGLRASGRAAETHRWALGRRKPPAATFCTSGRRV